MVYFTHKQPQQAIVFSLAGNVVLRKPNISRGPGTLATTGKFNSSAAIKPEDVRISTITTSG